VPGPANVAPWDAIEIGLDRLLRRQASNGRCDLLLQLLSVRVKGITIDG
jgi:hypothetical protein